MKKKTPAKDFMENLLGAGNQSTPESQPLAASERVGSPPPAPRQDYVPLANRLTIENQQMLARVVYHVKGQNIVRVLNDAMRDHLLKFPESQEPLPSEKPR